MTSLPELKSCPCCNSNASIFAHGFGNYSVACNICPIRTDQVGSANNAITYWNRRTPSPHNKEITGDAVTREDTACDKSQLYSSPTTIEDAELREAIKKVSAFNHYVRLGKTHHVEADYCDAVDIIINHAMKGQRG